jgi:predicted lipoprotein with Yx(FWY)xxD motif
MSRLKHLTVALTLLPLLAACAGPTQNTAKVAPLKTTETDIGVVITDADGMTLYTYAKDPFGSSDCAGRCARKWPPVAATAEPPFDSELTIIDREDGTKQYAWRGRPLYRWTKDTQPGQTTGHNLGEVWFAARP